MCIRDSPVAQKFGARDYSTMRSYVSVSLQLAVVMSVVIALSLIHI